MKPVITPLTDHDAKLVDATLAMRNAARAVDIPGFMPVCPDRFRGELAYAASHVRQEHVVARLDGGTVVGHAALTLPLRENLSAGQLELTVHPGHRRQGVGRALYAHTADRLRELRRTRVAGRTVEPVPEPEPEPAAGEPAADPHPARAFATAVGATVALEEHRYRLDLDPADPAAEQNRAELLAQARAAAATGYRVVTWRDRTPEEHVADAAYLATRIGTDAPSGELDWQAEQIDIDRVRETETGLAATRNHTYLAGAVHAGSGRMVALTMLARQHSVRDQCSQWITIVAPTHRGHRLGLLLKLANLDHIRTHEPELRTVDTWTAASNHHMIRINQTLGFRRMDRWLVWQAQV